MIDQNPVRNVFMGGWDGVPNGTMSEGSPCENKARSLGLVLKQAWSFVLRNEKSENPFVFLAVHHDCFHATYVLSE